MFNSYVVLSHSYKKKARNFPNFSALQEIYKTPPLLASFGGSWGSVKKNCTNFQNFFQKFPKIVKNFLKHSKISTNYPNIFSTIFSQIFKKNFQIFSKNIHKIIQKYYRIFKIISENFTDIFNKLSKKFSPIFKYFPKIIQIFSKFIFATGRGRPFESRQVHNTSNRRGFKMQNIPGGNPPNKKSSVHFCRCEDLWSLSNGQLNMTMAGYSIVNKMCRAKVRHKSKRYIKILSSKDNSERLFRLMSQAKL